MNNTSENISNIVKQNEFMEVFLQRAEQRNIEQRLIENPYEFLIYSVEQNVNHDNILLCLLNGANINHEDFNENNGLVLCLRQDNFETADFLISLGANKNKAVSQAAHDGQLDRLKYLINKGADPTENEDDAIVQAIMSGKTLIINYLVIEYNISLRPKTLKWIKDNITINSNCSYILELLEKKDLNERLETKLQTKIEKKRITMKL